jgi:RNA 2',3'-cyclic 3'-phosphodiesterase
MHRLFVALRPPPAIRAQLLNIMGDAEGLRWQHDGQLHITLRFIGEVDARTADDIAAALSRISGPVSKLRIAGVGTFESKGRVHTLWAGVAPREPLHALHKKIDRATSALGLQQDGRAYRPHVTLARTGGRAPDLAGFLTRHADLSSEPFAPDWFGLYESKSTAEGQIYDCVAKYPLTAQ